MATVFAVGSAVLFLVLNGRFSNKSYYRTFLIIALAVAVLLSCVCLFVFANDTHVDIAKAIFWGTCMAILLQFDGFKRKKTRKKSE